VRDALRGITRQRLPGMRFDRLLHGGAACRPIYFGQRTQAFMRIYWPSDKAPTILDGSWQPPGIERLN
jgi:hypothetical protein